MRWALAGGAALALLAGCHDFDADYAQCVASGKCAASDGSVLAGDGGVDGGPDGAVDGGADASVDAGTTSSPGFCDGMDGGWCWENPLPHGWTVRGLFVTDAGDVWTVGEGGLLGKWDGQTWSNWNPAGLDGQALNGVWSDSAGDTWAVGTGVFRWSGGAWVSPPLPVGAGGPYPAVWGSGGSDVWIAGPQSTLHWNGAQLAAEGPAGLAIDGTSSSSIWQASPDGGAQWTLNSFDGGGWSPLVGFSTPSAPTGLWTDGPTDVWLAGDAGLTRISVTAGPPIAVDEIDGGACQSVWATASDSLWATCWPPLDNVQLRSANGVWSSQLAAADATGTHLGALHGSDPSRPWIAGVNGLVLARQADGGWTRQTSGPICTVNHAFGFDAGAGRYEFLAACEQGVLHRTPDHWELLSGGGGTRGRGVWADSLSNIWTLTDTQLAHFDGTQWSAFAQPGLPAGHSLEPLWGTSSDDLWAGDPSYAPAPVVWHWSQGAWTSYAIDLTLGPVDHIMDLHGSGPSDVWAAGGHGVAHWDGTRWAAVTAGISWSVAIHANSPTDVWVVDTHGEPRGYSLHLWHGNAQGWAEFGALPVAVNSNSSGALWGTSSADVWLGGAAGLAMHWDGQNLAGPIQTASRQDLWSMWSPGAAGPVFATGPGGSIVRSNVQGVGPPDSGLADGGSSDAGPSDAGNLDGGTPNILVGYAAIAPGTDSTTPAFANAFYYVAADSGVSGSAYLYVDLAAPPLTLGIYSDNGSQTAPGTLLGQSTIHAVNSPGWNVFPLAGVTIDAGQPYWLAVYSSTAPIRYRDQADGGTSECDSTLTLVGLLPQWDGGCRYYSSGPMSAYVQSP